MKDQIQLVIQLPNDSLAEPPKAAQLPAMQSLYHQVERMGMEIDVLAPVHGEPVPWREFVEALEELGGTR